MVQAPPDLGKIPKLRGLRDGGVSKPWARARKGVGELKGPDADDAGREAADARRRQMEEMRQTVQEAYASLKSKRRSGRTQFVGSDL